MHASSFSVTGNCVCNLCLRKHVSVAEPELTLDHCCVKVIINIQLSVMVPMIFLEKFNCQQSLIIGLKTMWSRGICLSLDSRATQTGGRRSRFWHSCDCRSYSTSTLYIESTSRCHLQSRNHVQ